VKLLNRPALTHVYVYICYCGPVTPLEAMEALDRSKYSTNTVRHCSNFSDVPPVSGVQIRSKA
jgi:hypothetical protein